MIVLTAESLQTVDTKTLPVDTVVVEEWPESLNTAPSNEQRRLFKAATILKFKVLYSKSTMSFYFIDEQSKYYDELCRERWQRSQALSVAELRAQRQNS